MNSRKSDNRLRIILSDDERKAIDSALLILLASDEYLTESKATHDNAFNAGEKLEYIQDLTFTRGEARALTAAVDIALRLLSQSPEALAPVEAEFEGAVADITEARPILERLAPRLHAQFSNHRRK